MATPEYIFMFQINFLKNVLVNVQLFIKECTELSSWTEVLVKYLFFTRLEYCRYGVKPKTINQSTVMPFHAQHPLTNFADAKLCTRTGGDKIFFYKPCELFELDLKILCMSSYDNGRFSCVQLLMILSPCEKD